MQPEPFSPQSEPPPTQRPQKVDVEKQQHLAIRRSKASSWHTVKPAVSVATFIIGVIIAATAINAFIFQSYYVEGTSMTPTLHDNDRLIIDKTGHSVANLQGKAYVPERGDIVVLNSNLPDPSRTGTTEQLIKRVVGLPGERVVVENGIINIFNNEKPEGFNLDKNLHLALQPTFTTNRIDARLGEDELFVAGDNRGPGGSLDSRTFGPVDASSIEGRLWARIFPLPDATLF